MGMLSFYAPIEFRQATDILLILALALILDFTLGDPSNAFHPVAWMGRLISFLERRRPRHGNSHQVAYGVMFSLAVVTLFAVPAYFLLSYLRGVNFVAFIVVAALFLKLAFSFKGLIKAALKVKSLLLDEKLDEARFELRALVGRDAKTLSKPLLVSATVESVAENSCDSLVAPLFYFLIFGAPGAIAYRAVNTLDSMIGYHGRYEYLGKFASRLDDVLNYIPARLTAILLVLAAFLSKHSGRRSWQVALSDHSKTESPNAGWPMAATAGALNIQLEKVDYYKLGSANATLVPEAINSSLSLIRIAVVLWISVCFTIGGIYLAYST